MLERGAESVDAGRDWTSGANGTKVRARNEGTKAEEAMQTRKLLGAWMVGVLVSACGGGPEPATQADLEPGADGSEPAPASTEAGATENPAQAPAQAKIPTIDAVKKHNDEHMAAWAAHDAKKLMALHPPGAVIAMPGPKGLEEMTAAAAEKQMAEFFKAFPDAKLTTTRVLVKDDKAIAEWVVTGTNSGDFMGGKPTGKRVGYGGVSVRWLGPDGKVTRENMYVDQTTMMGQLGKAPKDAKVRAPLAAPTGATEFIVAKPGDEKNETTLRSLYAAMEKQDVKGSVALFSTDIVVSNAYYPEDIKGLKAVEKDITEGSKAFVDSKTKISQCISAGSFVACEFVWSATWKGPAMGMKPTGKTGTVHGVEIARLKDGKIAETHGYGNGVEFAATFGLMEDKPAPAKVPPPATSKSEPAQPSKAGALPPTAPSGPTKPAKAGSQTTPSAPPKDAPKDGPKKKN